MAIPFKYLPAIALLATLTFTANVALADEKPLKETDVEQVAIKLANETVQGGYKLLTVQEVKAMMDAKEDFVLIDAHPRNEFVLAYVDGATNFGFQSNRAGVWEKDMTVPGATQEQYKAALGSDLNKKVVIYCGFTKCGRSHNAAMWAKSLGYTNVYRAPGGITAWKDAGFPYKTITE